MAVRIRRDVATLATWDPIVLWYSRAVEAMQQRPVAHPSSWRYQAAIHDYVPGADPLAVPGEMLPTAAEQQRYWRQCQHFTWFFLPWHRMYLFYFEQIVALTITQLGGPAGWALPYWNYSDTANPDARRLPRAFREPFRPDGTPNPLFVQARNAGNTGILVGLPEDVDLAPALREPRFAASQTGASPGFGGAVTGFSHSGGNFSQVGLLERVPHGSMHTRVGGFMGRFHTAGLDPLFWLHHANIDRLWEVWRRRNPAHVDPAQAAWRTGVAFALHDALGMERIHTSSTVVTTTAPPLEYEYQDTSDPLAVREMPPPAEAAMDERTPEMVGASDTPVVLEGQPAVARLKVHEPTGPARETRARGAAPAAVYLNLENITGFGEPQSYGVYVNVPPGDTADAHPELFAGVLPMFGVAEASESTEAHPGSGLHYTLEISDLVGRLTAADAWDPDDVRVTFVPRPAEVDEPARRSAPSPIRVGRISIYLA